MDYKYIEQLLERYWQCETSLEEEEILRAFFSQHDVPAGLQQYSSLFAYAHDEKQAETPLGSDFDERMMNAINEMTPVSAQRITLTSRLKPLMRAAVIVGAIITVGTVAQLPFRYESDESAITQADGGSTTDTRSVAYDEVKDTFSLTASDTAATNKRFFNATLK